MRVSTNCQRPVFTFFIAIFVATTAGAALGVTTISSLPIAGTSVASRADMAQSFVVPATDNSLSSFSSYFFSSGPAVTYSTAIYPFNSTTRKVTGAAIYTGGMQTAPVVSSFPPIPETTFNFSPALSLASGGDYLLVLDQENYTNAGNIQMSTSDNYANGNLFFSAGLAPYTGQAWNFDAFDNSASMGFTAIFVPEPGIGLCTLAFMPLLIARRIGRRGKAAFGR